MILAAFMGDAAFYTLVAAVLLAVAGIVAAWVFAARATQRRAIEEERQRAAIAEAAEAAKKQRHAALVTRFGFDDALRIVRGEVWQGQTEVMLIEALGTPADQDEIVMKTKTKRTYKYRALGGKRYGLRVMLEDGLVVGWEAKK